uniref:Glutathione peroxidase n=1 Tax=Neolamprologus brichardi TaxID=32507 RepID=A0A3Q4H7S8_NEOBR
MFGHLNFTVLGFPCNQFGLQSPGKVNHEMLNILKYVRPGGGFMPKFPVFSKVEVNGLNEDPLFTFLKESLPFVNPVIGDIKKFYWSPIKVNDIRWNFEKFLITANVPFCHLMRFHVTATLFFNVMVSAVKKTDVNKTLYEKYAHGYCYFSLPIEFQYYFYI